MRGVLRCSGTRRALSHTGGGEKRVKELNFKISSTQSDEKREENHFDFTLVSLVRFQERGGGFFTPFTVMY